MAGEISPDIMFCVFCRKWSRMSAYGCLCVWMGAMGRMVTGGRKTRQKEPEMGKYDMFCDAWSWRKKKEGDRYDHGGQRRSFGGIGGKKDVSGTK